MPITTIVPHKDGGAWGWDDQAQAWVPVDQGAQQGSFLGNFADAAGRGFQEIEAGIQQLGNNPERADLSADILRLQSEAASNAAPWAEALGLGVPDLAAGVAVGALTGGAGLPAVIGAEVAAGAGMGALRPGSAEDRISNAALGAGFALGGLGLGAAAQKGIAAALKVGRGVTETNAASVARAIEVGEQRVMNARTRTEIEAAQAAGLDPGARPGGGSTAGAAQVPADQLDESTSMWNAALSDDDFQAASRMENPRVGKIMEDARAIGYEPSLWAEAGKGSRSRLMGALEEFSPNKDANEAARVTNNAELINRAAAKSMGLALTLDPAENTFTRITAGDLAKVEEYLDQGYKAVASEMPGIEPKQIITALDGVEDDYRHLVGSDLGMDTLAQLKQNLAKSDAAISGQQFVNTIQALTGLSADAYSRPGGSQSGQLLYDMVNRLYHLGEKATKDAPAGFGRGSRDHTITGKGWAELRREAQMYMILRRPGAIDPAGNINPRTVYNAMAKQKTAGGFGRGGPPKGNANYELFKLAEAHGYDQTGVPPTGVRLAGLLAKPALRNAGAAAGAATGVAGLGALGGSIW